MQNTIGVTEFYKSVTTPRRAVMAFEGVMGVSDDLGGDGDQRRARCRSMTSRGVVHGPVRVSRIWSMGPGCRDGKLSLCRCRDRELSLVATAAAADDGVNPSRSRISLAVLMTSAGTKGAIAPRRAIQYALASDQAASTSRAWGAPASAFLSRYRRARSAAARFCCAARPALVIGAGVSALVMTAA